MVLIIPGSGPTDRDGNNPAGIKAATYRLLAEGLASRGVATLRIDKRDMFASAAATPDANAVTIADYVVDVQERRHQAMTRYVALLRGVSPLNAKMPELKRAFETAGFTKVNTVLSSGNVVFDARAASEPGLERKAEACMQETLGRTFYTIVRPVSALQSMLEIDPYAAFPAPAGAKRVVSFLRQAVPPRLALPLESDGAQVLTVVGREVFTAYVPSDKGPVFLKLIGTAFGRDVTTRTWGTVKKCAAA